MQDRYTGDVGDFGKYGLLRALCRPADVGPALRLGVVWYRVPDESHNLDGKHTGYLRPSGSNSRRFRACDPELYDKLAAYISSGRRSLADLPGLDILPPDTRYFDEPLTFTDVSRQAPADLKSGYLPPPAVLNPLSTEGKTGPLAVYFGRMRTVNDDSPFSFFPARLFGDLDRLFARPLTIFWKVSSTRTIVSLKFLIMNHVEEWN